MKIRLYLICIFLSSVYAGQSQNYLNYNVTLLGHIAPNTSSPSPHGSFYSGCWGWYQTTKQKEYAISGTSNGTYFIDVTHPSTPTVSAFVAGLGQSVYREMKTYQHYCYIVSDDGGNRKFQIVDLQYLPDSVHLVYDDSLLLMRAHTIWIDDDKMYVGGMTDNLYTSYSMAVFSLATPTAPVLLRKLDQDIPTIHYVHDMYVKKDTIYASAASQGLFVLKYDTALNKFNLLGSYNNYQYHGYNHSSTLTYDGKHLFFCDEVPATLPVHIVNIENLSNIQPVVDFHPLPKTTAHNPFMKDKFVILSSYQDGLFIYDVSQPASPSLAGYFDTYPQGGDNWNADYGLDHYRGNWGAYPYLPSGIIIANDMQNGVFILDASAAYTTTVLNPVGLESSDIKQQVLTLYPNPGKDAAKIYFGTNEALHLTIKNALGQPVFEKDFSGVTKTIIDLRSYDNGTYVVNIKGSLVNQTKKLIVSH